MRKLLRRLILWALNAEPAPQASPAELDALARATREK